MPKSECPVEISGLLSDDTDSELGKIVHNPVIPFVHKFQTDHNRYLYDANTSRILRVDPVVWDIIGDFGCTEKDEIIAKYSFCYKSNEVLSAYDAILNAQQQDGLLLANRPQKIMMPYDEDCLREKLTSRRGILTLCVTESCNFRCSYCVYGEKYPSRRIHSGRMMSWDTAQRAIDEFLKRSKNAEIRSINFYGGEPLLNFSLIRKCVEYVRQQKDCQDMRFAFTTNGALMSGEIADFIASEGIVFVVSLDGNASIHDRNRLFVDGSPTWEKIIHNVRIFLRKYPEYRTNGKIGFHAVIAPPINLLELEEFFTNCDFLTDQMAFTIGWIVLGEGTFIKSLSPDERKVEGLATLYERFLNNLETGMYNKNCLAVPLKVQAAFFERTFLEIYKRGYSTKNKPSLPQMFCPLPMCIPGIRKTFVSVNGNYYVCERTPEIEEMEIGNVREGINISKVRRILKKFVDLNKEECRYCWCLPNCRMGCAVTVMKDGKMNKDFKRKACAIHRKVVHRSMVNMCKILERNCHALDYIEQIKFV